MNIYLLVEGARTERIVYPKWLGYLIPNLKEIKDPFILNEEEDCGHTFYIFSGGGFPSLLDNHLRNSVSDVNEIPKINYLVVVLDSDEESREERLNYVNDFISQEKLILKYAEFVIIVQNKCIETWMLGNRRVYPRNSSSSDLQKYSQHYNVKDEDPEFMVSDTSSLTTSSFHFSYLRKMLEEKNISYTKKNPRGVVERHYLDELIKRQKETGHLLSFKHFIDFCELLNKKMKF